MAITKSSLGAVLVDTVYVDSAATNTARFVVTTGATFYQVDIDNTANSDAVYVKVFDLAAGVTPGTTDPNFIFKAPALTRLACTCSAGVALTNGFGYTCVKESGTVGTTAPDNDVTMRVLLDD